MHPTLRLPEILLNIFNTISYYPKFDRATVASLARTCRTFKEPALDVLWEDLESLFPLVQCLPEASRKLSTGQLSFCRPLTDTEWNILQSYTRRIRCMRLYGFNELNKKSLKMLIDAPIIEPLFPNLHDLDPINGCPARHLSHIPLPSLTFINMWFMESKGFRDTLESFATFSPNVKRLHISMSCSNTMTFTKTVSHCICLWQNMQIMECSRIGLDIDALVHLSRMPALSSLAFALDATFPTLDPPLLFSNLHKLRLQPQRLDLVSQFLSNSQLPAIRSFRVYIDSCPSRHELSSFLSSILMYGAGQTIEELALEQSYDRDDSLRSEVLVLGMEDLQPCLSFSNLCSFWLEIGWQVDLKDSGVLALASSWPGLRVLGINREFGWNTQNGITPDGLLQLLQRCPSLYFIDIAIDTRGYTALPSSELLQLTHLTSERQLHIDVVDSKIEVESVPAIAAFFARILRSTGTLEYYWCGSDYTPDVLFSLPSRWNSCLYRERWDDVQELMEMDPHVGG